MSEQPNQQTDETKTRFGLSSGELNDLKVLLRFALAIFTAIGLTLIVVGVMAPMMGLAAV